MIFGNSEFSEFKFYIQVRFKLGSAINEIFKELKIVIPKGHLSLSTLTRWMNQFKRKAGDLKDNHRIGRPITETIRTKIERFWDDIENNSL
jgi:transposase